MCHNQSYMKDSPLSYQGHNIHQLYVERNLLYVKYSKISAIGLILFVNAET